MRPGLRRAGRGRAGRARTGRSRSWRGERGAAAPAGRAPAATRRRTWRRAKARGSSPGSAERLRTALAHAVEPLGEGVVGEDADVAEAPHGGRGVDVAAEAGLVHQAEDGLERRLAPVGALEAVGAGVEERDGGDGEALAPVAEHLGDG